MLGSIAVVMSIAAASVVVVATVEAVMFGS